MRISIFLLGFVLCLFPIHRLDAQDPGAQQDAEAAREKLLKASDELENIQANSEATKTSVDGLKTDVAELQQAITKLQSDNATLKQQLADLQAILDQFKSEQIKARQALIDNVAGMIAAQKEAGPTKSGSKKKNASTEASIPVNSSATSPTISETATQREKASAESNTPSPGDDSAQKAADNSPPAKSQKGYYHVVASGETLTLICAAYRENGVDVSVSEIRKANGLTAKSVLKEGQKLFIPKPGA